ncbi:MAG TPA: tetratricopeptide repeat protein [bacterium (Candidatus Stahlbacteria)]|nr:tetratricopeptide repeat protein [Candidatus Stahlbacteria bacterium]
MAIKGSLSEASLSDVIQMICASTKTGCLSITDGSNFGTIFVKDGKIALADLRPHKRRIGDILVQSGKITDAQLDEAIRIQKENRDKKLGAILIEKGTITEDDLIEPLKLQTEDALFTMLLWDSGYFSFEPDLRPGADEIILDIPYEGLLIDSVRRIDEWKEIEDKLPPKDTILIKKKSPVQLKLTESEEAVLDLINDERSLADITSMSPLSTVETCKAIHVLFTAGLVDASKAKVEEAETKAKERREVGLAFYKTKMYNEAIQELSRVLDIDPENMQARFYLGLAYYRIGNFKEAIEHLSKVGDKTPVLYNLACCYWRLGEPEEALSILNRITELDPDSPKILLSLGILNFEQKNNTQAKNYFNTLKEKDPDHFLPYFYLPLLSIRDKDYQEGISQFATAIEKYPSKVELRNNLAVLLETMGKSKDAEQAYRDAIKQDPFNPQLRKNFGSFYYNRNIIGAAREQFEAIEESFRDWEINFKLANIMLKLGKRSEALEYYKRAQKQKPNDSIIERNLKILEHEEQT